MPITAYSNEAAREVDLEQWLALNGYSVQDDPLLEHIPSELREKAALDIECSGCRARGATLVRVARAKGGRSVGQGHFRFLIAGGTNPHDPLCEFYNEDSDLGSEYLADFRNEKSALTRTVRDLVCRGIRANLFSQPDMRRMRLWFLQERTKHAITLDVTPELIQWCADMWATNQVWSPDQISFRSEHGQLPDFNWDSVATREWVRRNVHLFEAVELRVHFRQETIKRPLQLIAKYAGMRVLDPTALSDKYANVIQFAGFAAGYVFRIAGVQAPKAFRGHVSDWGPQSHVLLALSALLLFKNDWDVGRASAMFSKLTTLQPATEGLEGNIIGLNPFHDYPAWQVINAARQIAALRTDCRPVKEQVTSLKAEIQASYFDWAAQAFSERCAGKDAPTSYGN